MGAEGRRKAVLSTGQRVAGYRENLPKHIRRRSPHLWGIDSNGDAVDWRLYPGCCCGPRLGSRRPISKFAADEPDAAVHIRPMFAANDPFDAAKSTHLFIVKMAAKVASKQGKVGKKFYDIFRPDQVHGDVFHEAVCQGVYDADYLPQYNNPANDGKLIQPTYKSHFYDPDTGKNWLGDTDPTALTMGHKLCLDSLYAYHRGDMRAAGYALGLSLHYLTDLGQPMHAANFTWLGPPMGWHSKFEEEIVLRHQSDHVFDNDPYQPYQPYLGTFPDDYFIELAKRAKKMFQDYNLQKEDDQNAIRVTPQILRQVITFASQYMVAWMERADSTFQPYWHFWSDNGAPTGRTIAGPAGVTTVSGRPCAFVRSSDGHLWANWWDGAKGQWSDHGTPSGATVAGPVGAVTSVLKTHAFVQGSDGHLWANRSLDGGATWGWIDHGTPSGATVAGPVGAVTGGLNTHAFVQGSDGHLWANLSSNDGATWGWSDQGTLPGGAAIAGPVGVCADPRVGNVAYVRSSNGHLWLIQWDGGAKQWRWIDHGGLVTGPVGVVTGSPTSDDYVYVHSDGHLWCRALGPGIADGARWIDHGTPPRATVTGPVGAVTSGPTTSSSSCKVAMAAYGSAIGSGRGGTVLARHLLLQG